MPRSRKIFLLLGLAIALIAVCGFMAWKQWRTHRTYYSDGQSIRQPINRATVRDVLWREPRALPATVNSNDNELQGRLSADGLVLYFVRGRPGQNADLYVSLRMAETGPDGVQQWSEPEPLAILNTSDDEFGPEPSRDGRSLLFYSNRPEGLGGYDIWVSMRSADGFQPPINLGPAVNTEFDEMSPALSPEADRIAFASNRPRIDAPESHDSNLYMSTIGADGAFAAAVAMDELNTLANDSGPSFSPTGDFLYFSSDRKPGFGGHDLYRARITRGEFQSLPANLGSEINTAANEREPGPCLDGFGLTFSSDRDRVGEAGRKNAGVSPQSDLYYTSSREVFREVEAARALDWAAIAALLLPAIIWALVGCLAIVVLLMLLKQVRTRTMSLLARCLVASLAAHLALLIMLTFWQVTSSIVEVLEHEGSIQIAVTSSAPGSGDELYSQVRGEFTSVELASQAGAAGRMQTEMLREQNSESAHIPVSAAPLTFNDQQASAAELRDAPATVPAAPEVAVQQVSNEAVRVAVDAPLAPVPTSASESAAAARAGEIAAAQRHREIVATVADQRQRTVAMAPENALPQTVAERSVAGAATVAEGAARATDVSQTPPNISAPEQNSAGSQFALMNPPLAAPQGGIEAGAAIQSRAGGAARSAAAANAAPPFTDSVVIAPRSANAEPGSQSMANAGAVQSTGESTAPRSNRATELPVIAAAEVANASGLTVPADRPVTNQVGDPTVSMRPLGQLAGRSSLLASNIAASTMSSQSGVQLAPQRVASGGVESSMTGSATAATPEAAVGEFAVTANAENNAAPSTGPPIAASLATPGVPTDAASSKGDDATIILSAAGSSAPRAVAGSTGANGQPIPSAHESSAQFAPVNSPSIGTETTMAATGASGALRSESAITGATKVEHLSPQSLAGQTDHALAATIGTNLPAPPERAGAATGAAEPGVGISAAPTSQQQRARSTGSLAAARIGETHLPPGAISTANPEEPIMTGGQAIRGAAEAAMPTRAAESANAPSLAAVGDVGHAAPAAVTLPGAETNSGSTLETATPGVALTSVSRSVMRADTSSAGISASTNANSSRVAFNPLPVPSGIETDSPASRMHAIRESSVASIPSSSPTSSSSGSLASNLPALAAVKIATPAELGGDRNGSPGDEASLQSPRVIAAPMPGPRGHASTGTLMQGPIKSGSARLSPESGKGIAARESSILKPDQRISEAPHGSGNPTATGQGLHANLSAPTASAAALDLHIPKEVAPAPSPYVQRSEDIRKDVVKKMGGSEATEKAVEMALKWFANHQSADGRWAAKGFDHNCNDCGGEAKFDTDVAATALALLCFLAADHTHTKDGPYRENVARGLAWLKTQQKDDGDFRGGETMYSHGIATIAMAEAFGMTSDNALGMQIKKSVDFISAALNRRVGGWRYEPGQAGDTSVLGWQIMAITSARRAGIPVPDELYKAAADWMNIVDAPGSPGLYAYQPGQRYSPSMTAEGMFVQQLAGRTHDDPRMRSLAEFIMQNPPRWSEDPNTYYWYYATLALFQHQGKAWKDWNRNLTEVLLANQQKTGPAAGSWDPLDNWSKIGGRVYQTAMCTLCLEVYYRYLPMYAAVEREEGE